MRNEIMKPIDGDDQDRECPICGDIDGYYLYACEHCEAIWCGDDPLLKTDPVECACGGGDVDAGWVQCCECNQA